MWNAAIPKPLCPTRWCVRFIAIDTALKSYELLVPYLSEVSNMSTVDDSAAKSRGLLAQFENGLTYLILTMMHNVFALVESLSRILQASNRTVTGALEAVQITLRELQQMRSDEHFTTIWLKAQSKISQYSLHAIKLPRHVRAPSRYEQGKAQAHVFESSEILYRVQYFNFLDAVINHITGRFEQPGMKTYSDMEALVVSACKRENFTAHLDSVCQVYDDFDKKALKRQLKQLPGVCPLSCYPAPKPDICSLPQITVTVSSIIEEFAGKSNDVRKLLAEVERLFKFLVVVPASSATAERSFSTLRRLKTYLRATMAQERLNHLAVLHVHKSRVDALELSKIKQLFISANDYRRSVFGQPSGS